MLKKLFEIKKELLGFTASERVFVFCAMLSGFCICATYAIVRPICDAVFITSYGTELFPYAWLAVIPLNLFIVALYNRFLPRLGCWKMFLTAASLIAGINVIAALFLKTITPLPFLFYLWKEVFILFLFQLLWSVIHATIPLERAKYLYGMLFAVGGVGTIAGSLIPGFFAVKAGSENLLFATLPVLFLLGLAYKKLLSHGNPDIPAERKGERGSLQEGWNRISKSQTLTFILLIVMLMQIVSTLVYYQFNTVLADTIGDKDLRTEFCGKISSIGGCITVLLQLFGSFLLVHFLGLKRSHLLIPAVLGGNAAGVLLFPTFGMVSYAYVTIKSFDFSIFGILKEMLYIPLKKEEKFQAKAVIDVFAYRTAKAAASFLILFVQWIHAPKIVSLLSYGALVLLLFWIWIVARLLKTGEETIEAQS